jgi:lipopolysaccharide transport system permease protein
MTEIRYDARPALADPARFIREAVSDLARAPSIGWRLFVTGLSSRYRRSYFGYFWLLAPTLATAAIAVYLRSRNIVALQDTALPYALHVLAGMMLWQVFLEALNTPLQRLTSGRQMITKSRAPHEALIWAGLLEVLLNAAIRMVVLALAMIPLGVWPGASVMLLPVGIVSLVVLGLAFGLLLVPWGLLYEDVGRGLLLLTGIWFFLTPIFYPAPTSGLLRFNPVTPVLDVSRSWIAGPAPAGEMVMVTAAAALAVVVGWLLYRLAKPHVVAQLG